MEAFFMMKLSYLVFGFTPLLAGYIINEWIMNNMDSVLPYRRLSIFFLIFWTVLGFFLSKEKNSLKEVALWVHAPAIFMLLLIVLQIGIQGRHWDNALGMIPQLFYLPLINLAGALTFGIGRHMLPIYIISFILLCLAFQLGTWLREKLR